MNKLSFCLVFFLMGCLPAGRAQLLHTVWLDDLPIQTFSEGLRPVNPKANYFNDSMRLNGVFYARGIGLQSVSVLAFYLDKNAKRFTAVVGADDHGNKEIPLKFYVLGDRKILFESREMKIGDAPQKIDISLEGIERLGLLVTDRVGGSNNKRTYADWADAQLQMIGDKMPGHFPVTDEKYILTPAPGKLPRINSAALFGATPGNPFLYCIAATGNRPMSFSASGLPTGLSLDTKTGIITGRANKRGTYTAILEAKNGLGKATKKLRIIIGDTIALTPPIGWNGWNAWESTIDREKVIAV